MKIITPSRYIIDHLATVCLAVAGAFLLLMSVAGAQAISRGYATDDTGLKPGMVVRLSPASTAEKPKVERASLDDLNQVIGVATTIEGSVVTIASKNGQVYVETSGEVDAYVSDLNGTIQKGDVLTVSPLKGILAKANEGSPILFGIALEDAEGKQTESYTVASNEGSKQVAVTKIRINLDRKAANNAVRADSSLERLGRSVTGKDVGEIRVVIALIIFFMVLVAEGGILYGAVSSAITALGRNPLAKGIIKRELIRVMFIALLVLLIGLAAVYGVLWF
jgi:hypothetical protein